MKKNNYKSLVLLIAFSFVLVHNVIPHHHHDEISEVNTHEHHHHSDKDEKDHHSKNDEPIGLFSHQSHVFASTEFIFRSYNSFQKTQYVGHVFLIDDYILKPSTISIRRAPPYFLSANLLRSFYDKHFLRGPPAFSV